MRSVVCGAGAMALVVVVSNVAVQYPIADGWLTYGAFSYPVAFLVTDVMNRVYGPAIARQVVFAGFLAGLACSLIGTQIVGAYGPLVTLRIAVGSGVAFLVAQTVDLAVFSAMRGRVWWQPPFVSTLIGGSLDTALFFTIAFSGALAFVEPGNDVAWANAPRLLWGMGPVVPYWAGLALTDWCVKLVMALLALLPFRRVTLLLLMPSSRG